MDSGRQKGGQVVLVGVLLFLLKATSSCDAAGSHLINQHELAEFDQYQY
jgi:hypothetical protein